MALGFSSGLLSGLQNYGQGGTMPSDPRDQNLLQKAGVTNPLLQQFGQGFGGLFGIDMRSQNQQVAGAFKGLDPSDPQSLLKVAQTVENYDPVKAAELRGRAAQVVKEKEALAEEKRKQLAAEAAEQSRIRIQQDQADIARERLDLEFAQFNKTKHGFIEMTDGSLWATNPDTGKAEKVATSGTGLKGMNAAQKAALYKDFTPESIAGYFAEGTPLVNIIEPRELSENEVKDNIEKLQGYMEASSGIKSIDATLDKLYSQGKENYTGGIMGTLKTAVYAAAGVSNETEQAKREFVQKRNTGIVKSLPAGAASNTDVEIFSKGYPPENAPYEDVVAYLQAERNIMAASADHNRLYLNHINKGGSATDYTDEWDSFSKTRDTLMSVMANDSISEETKQETLQQFKNFYKFTPHGL